MYQKLKTGSDPECMCVKKSKNTRDHNLKQDGLHRTLKEQICSSATSVTDKLYEDINALKTLKRTFKPESKTEKECTKNTLGKVQIN